VEDSGRATRSVTIHLLQPQTRTVTCNTSNGSWVPGTWMNAGTPRETGRTRGSWTCKPEFTPSRITRPPGGTNTVTTTSDAWVVSGSVAMKVRTTTTESFTTTVTWQGPTTCNWSSRPDSDGPPAMTTETIETKVRPATRYWSTATPEVPTGRTKVIRVSTTPVCLEQTQRELRWQTMTRWHNYVWREPNWVAGRTHIFNLPGYRYRWENYGAQRLCAIGGFSDEEEETPRPLGAEYAAGSHTVAWGADWFSFTVPADATVRLSARLSDAGDLEALFVTPAGAQLAIVVADLADGPPPNAIADPTLSALAATLRLADPPPINDAAGASGATASPQRNCDIWDGAAPVILNPQTGACTVASSGTATVRLGANALRITFNPTDADAPWLIFAASVQDAPEGIDQTAIWLVDTTSGAAVALNPATGAERTRLPRVSDATDARLDAIARSATTTPES